MIESSEPVTLDEVYGPTPMTEDEIDEILDAPRGPLANTSLYDMVGALGVGPQHTVLDIGARDGCHGLELAARYGCRVVVVDPSDTHVDKARKLVAGHTAGHLLEVRPGSIEAIPSGDGVFDLVWARDMLSHVLEIGPALAETRRVLAEDGAVVVYQTFATALLEAAEAERIYAGLAVVPERMAVAGFEESVGEAGFDIGRCDVIGSQWREAWEEDGSGKTSRQLLHSARLIRKRDRMTEELGDVNYRIELANALWGIYQMIGKLEPRVYVLRVATT